MITLEEIRDYCLSLPHAEESQPFGDDLLVFKVGGRIFAILSLTDARGRVNVKCDPDRAIELRDHYEAIIPGFHMNKRHWNTILCDSDLPKQEVLNEIKGSYDLIIGGLPKSKRL